jgi:tripartite-type tricarboxylate transporter receptor subunit TctC
LIVSMHAPARAQSVADFYRGKSINLLVGSGEGGGFDASARLLAQFFPKYMPGAPSILVQNTPGASGLRVAEIVSNLSPRDGTTIAITQPQMTLNKVLDPAGRYRPQDMLWIGRMGAFVTFIVVRSDAPVQTVELVKQKELIIGASAPTGPGVLIPSALNELAGTKFKMVKGYRSAQETGLALDRGEIQGIGSAAFEFVDSKGWLKTGFAKMLATIGMKRHHGALESPTVLELMSNARDTNVMKIVISGSEIGRAFMAPPGVPVERLAALREAFDKMVRDPEFVEESEKRGFVVEPMSGADLQKLISEIMSMDEDVARRTREITTTGAN